MRCLKVEEKYFYIQCIMNSWKCSVCIKELEEEDLFFVETTLHSETVLLEKCKCLYLLFKKIYSRTFFLILFFMLPFQFFPRTGSSLSPC